MALALGMAVIPGLSAQEPARTDMSETKVTAISVSGLKRTKPYILERPLQKFIGMDAGSIDTNDVYAIIQSTGILEPVSVELIAGEDGSGSVLSVTVREKWAIFPVPIVSVTSSGWGAGLAFMDTNAFGVKDNMMVMGMYGSDAWMASLMYIKTPKGVGEFGWNAMGWFNLQENENTDQAGDQTLRRYNSMSIKPSFGVSYQLSELITPGIALSYQYDALRDIDNPMEEPENDMQGITLSPGISIRRNTWDGYFLNEKQVSVKYGYTFVPEDTDVHSVSMNAAFNHSIIPGFRLIAKSGVVFATPSAAPFYDSSPINAAVNILPAKYAALDFAGLSVGLEKYLFKFKFGTIAMAAAYQAVYSHGDLLAYQFDHGPVAMVQMYLSRVALPGIGLGGAYNVDKNTWQFAFNIGMTF
jgi:hypothetical protein